MRTTIEIRDELFRQAKRRAADEGAPLRQIVESALRLYLSVRGKRGPYRFKWGTDRGRLLPGVVIEDRDSLFDIMEGRR
jgi:hypothetical protein